MVAEVELSNVKASVHRSDYSSQYRYTIEPACVKPIKFDPKLPYTTMIQLKAARKKLYMLPV